MNLKSIKSIKGIKSFLGSNFFTILILILSIIPLFNLFHPGLPVTHDGQDHVARIANFYQNLQEGSIVPRWAGNLNWGYGHPILMFLYPLPSYLASLFHLFGFSLVDSIKLVFGFSFIFSILAMYIWLKQFLSEKAAVIGSLLYGLASYHLVDLYIRGAVGEMVAFIFPPLVLYFIYLLSRKNNYWYFVGGSFSMAALILSHNAVSLMFLPIIILYILLLIYSSKDKSRLMYQFTSILIIGFSLSAFFWLPAFIEGKYTLRDVVTRGGYINNFVSLQQLFYWPWNYGKSGITIAQIGLLNVLAVFASLPLIKLFHKNKNYLFALGMLFIFILSVFLMTSSAKIVWEKITILQKFQFPWRFLFLTMFSSAVLGAYVFSSISKKFEKVVFVCLIILLLFFTKDMWQTKSFLQKPESFFTDIYSGTTDTGESAPIWSVRFMEDRPKSHIELIGGRASIQEGRRTTIVHEYKVNASINAQLRENTIYFPGWKVLVDNKPVPIEFQDPNNRGVMTFRVDKGDHDVIVRFEETRLRLVSDIISLFSLFVLIVLGILRKRKLWQS